VYAKSKIVLNSSPHLKGGLQERILNGMLRDALVVTNDCLGIRNAFDVSEEVVTYNHFETEKLNDRINHLLSNKSLREEIAGRGRKRACLEHTWDERVKSCKAQLPAHMKLEE
jgi:spore maturation protein CgeB